MPFWTQLSRRGSTAAAIGFSVIVFITDDLVKYWLERRIHRDIMRDEKLNRM